MIITQMGDALLPKWGTPHYRTDGDDYYPNGGRIVVQMGDAAPTLWLAFMIGLRIQKWCQNMLV